MRVLYAANPKWGNRNQTAVDLIVRFEGIDEDLPFTASLNDAADYGRDLYTKAVAGEFGGIEDFKPVALPMEYVTAVVREHRDYKLKNEVDPVVSNMLRWNELTLEQQQDYASYRTALLNCTSDPAFPWYNAVVIETNFGFVVDPTLAPWPVAPE